MVELSAKGAASVSDSSGKSVSSSTTADSGASPRHLSKRFRSFLKKPFSSPSLKAPSTSSLNASLSSENDGDDRRSGDGFASTTLPSGEKPGGDPNTPQPSHSTARGGIAVTGAARDPETAVSIAVPIAELWNQAYEKLREQEPKLIEKYEEEISESFHVSTMVGTTVAMSGLGKVRRREQMELLVKQKLKIDEDGKWRVHLGDDRIAIRDLAGHVVSILDWGKDFIGTALESSPYGSIAWAGVCLLLPLILNPSKQRASNICGLEYISDLLSRCAMYEDDYHQQYEISCDGLTYKKLDLGSDRYESALKELYLRILRFEAQSVCQFSRGLVRGGVRAMFKIDDWDALLEDIKVQEGSCQAFFDSVKHQKALDAREEGHRRRTLLLLEKLENLNLGIKGIRDKLQEIHFSDEENRCFETLRTSNYLARKDLNPKRLPGTCKWFLDHPKYQQWIDPSTVSRLLWVSADPGCGKSVLAKSLVDQYDRGSVCYYFFKDDTTITRSAAHAICAILHQICDLRPGLIKYVLPMYRRNGGKLVDLFEDLWSAFADIINDKDFGNVICVLDAVDECSDADQEKLLQRLTTIATSTTSIKILITSRPYTSIDIALFDKTGLDRNEIRLSGYAGAEMRMIEKEVGFFIASRVEEFRELRKSKGINADVHEKLQSHLDGVKNRTYLWVSAVFNELEREVNAPRYFLLQTIKALPDNVGKAYENILAKSPKPKKLILTRVLHVMLAAFRPLSLMEMNVVLSIQDTSTGLEYSDLHPGNSFGEWLRDLCGFFISIVDNQLYFAHQTAREFLVGNYQASVGWRGSFQLAESHTLIARICIDYLLLLYGRSLDATFETYATIYWPAHCQSLEVDQPLAERVKGFLFPLNSPISSFARWIVAVEHIYSNLDLGMKMTTLNPRIYTSISSAPTPLFLACKFGWPSVIDVLKSSSDFDWNMENQIGQTGLQIAAKESHLEIVKLLLKAGADVNNRANYGETALHSAASRGHLKIAKFLLTAGADFTIQNDRGNTALHIAASEGHLEMFKLFVKAGADVNMKDNYGETPLHSATSMGHLEIVKFLLNAEVDVNQRGMHEETALHLASSRGDLEIVKLLLAEGADANIQDSQKDAALYKAVWQRQLEVVKLLLMAGAHVDSQDCYEHTALHLAAAEGYLEIVKLLLEAGADVNVQGKRKVLALHVAVSKSEDLEIVKLLLAAGADVNMKSGIGTALHIAKERNNVEIEETLLAAGAIDSQSQVYSSSSPAKSLVISRPNSVSSFAYSRPASLD